MRNEFVAVRLSTTEKKLLEKHSKRFGCPASDFIRGALRLMFQGMIVMPQPKQPGAAVFDQEQGVVR